MGATKDKPEYHRMLVQSKTIEPCLEMNLSRSRCDIKIFSRVARFKTKV